MIRLVRFLADILYVTAAILYAPLALYNAVVLGKNRHGWRQRFGYVPSRNPAKPRVWIHAVSLGEVNATPSLVAALREAMPELDIVVSSTTDTGYNRAVQLYGADRVFRFPLDFSFVIRRVLGRIAPKILVLIELEVWFNLVHQSHSRGISVCVANGRLTARSARRLGRLGPFARSMFRRLAWVGAQDRIIADRFIELGTPAERVEVTSSMKWDTAVVADTVPGADALREALAIDPREPLWVCGSTGPGEEEIILEAYAMLLRQNRERCPGGSEASPRLAIIPRKPERFDEVARLIEARGFMCLRRSRCPDHAPLQSLRLPDPSQPHTACVILGDTLGELRKFYALATVVFVGRSLVPMGGSDPIEVAALGKPILCGPYMENFQEPVAAMREAGTLTIVEGPTQLTKELSAHLDDPETTFRRGRIGQAVVRRHQGATSKTCARILDILRPVCFADDIAQSEGVDRRSLVSDHLSAL